MGAEICGRLESRCLIRPNAARPTAATRSLSGGGSHGNAMCPWARVRVAGSVGVVAI
jgi:hypothetical protein